MNINIYRTRTMLAAVLLMLPVQTFLRSTFFPNSQTFVTEEVLLDFKKGKRKMAPFVAPRIGGITMDRDGYRTDKYAAPRIAPQRGITVDDLVLRGMGENVFSQRTPADRQAELLGRDIAEFDDMITRREEWMAAQILFTGKIVMKGFTNRTDTYIEQELDYGFTNKDILTDTHKWDQSTSTKYADLEEWRLEVIKASGKAPEICVMSRDVWALFRKDEDILKMLDVRNLLLATVNPVIKSPALTFVGRLTELGLDIYVYNEWYLDDDGVEQPMVPEKHLLLGSPNIGEYLYGAVTQMEEDGQFYTYEGARVPKSWADRNNEQRMLRLSSRPVPKPEDIDSWFVAQVY